MAILKIARMGHSVLHQVAEPVDDPASPEVTAIVRDMIETLDDAGGIGLAAPQVHIPKRIVVFFIPGARANPDAGDGDGEEGEGLQLGQRVFHQKFGYGAIKAIDGDKLEIAFEKALPKTINGKILRSELRQRD